MSGELAEIGLPVPMTVALPPPEDRSFADVWTALGRRTKTIAGRRGHRTDRRRTVVPRRARRCEPPTVITEGLAGSVPGETRRGGAVRVAAAGEREAARDGDVATAYESAGANQRRRRHGQAGSTPVVTCWPGRRWWRNEFAPWSRIGADTIPRRTIHSAACTSATMSSTPYLPMPPPPDVERERRLDVERAADHAEAAGADVRLRRLARTASLSDDDVELLVICLLPDLDSRFERLYGYLNDDVTRRRATVGSGTRTGRSVTFGRDCARPTGSRCSAGRELARTDRGTDRPFLTRGDPGARPGDRSPARRRQARSRR